MPDITFKLIIVNIAEKSDQVDITIKKAGINTSRLRYYLSM